MIPFTMYEIIYSDKAILDLKRTDKEIAIKIMDEIRNLSFGSDIKRRKKIKGYRSVYKIEINGYKIIYELRKNVLLIETILIIEAANNDNKYIKT